MLRRSPRPRQFRPGHPRFALGILLVALFSATGLVVPEDTPYSKTPSTTSGQEARTPQILHGRVTRVGDDGQITLETTDGALVRFALAGVVLPDRKTPVFDRARAFLQQLRHDAMVSVELSSTTETGGPSGLIYQEPGAVSVNEQLLLAGLARVSPEHSTPSPALLRAEHQARLTGQGLWGAISGMPARPWRTVSR